MSCGMFGMDDNEMKRLIETHPLTVFSKLVADNPDSKVYRQCLDNEIRNVAESLLLKSNPIYYNDSICKSGYFRGRQTVSYVANVNHYYTLYCSKIKR